MSMRYAAAALQGQAHQLKGLPCQDWAAGTLRAEVAAAVLCDGAGSCPGSELAARRVCGWALDFVPEEFEALWRGTEREAARCLARRGQAALAEAGLADVLCTMLLFACHRDGRWLAAHIGDGCLFLRENGEVRLLSGPENGRLASETFFLCEPDAAEHLRVYRSVARGELQALLASDGCGEALCDGALRRPAPAVGVMCGWLAGYGGEAVSQALSRQLEELFSTQSDDDLSLAIVHWTEDSNRIVEQI